MINLINNEMSYRCFLFIIKREWLFFSNLLDPFNRWKGYERDLIGKKRRIWHQCSSKRIMGMMKRKKKKAKFIFLSLFFFLATPHTLWWYLCPIDNNRCKIPAETMLRWEWLVHHLAWLMLFWLLIETCINRSKIDVCD
jgi:hypothetical protein